MCVCVTELIAPLSWGAPVSLKSKSRSCLVIAVNCCLAFDPVLNPSVSLISLYFFWNSGLQPYIPYLPPLWLLAFCIISKPNQHIDDKSLPCILLFLNICRIQSNSDYNNRKYEDVCGIYKDLVVLYVFNSQG